jgi:hypothetical protein
LNQVRVELIPAPSEEIRKGLYSVIGGALAGGAPHPSWVSVDDGSDTWAIETSNRFPADRARSVIAAAGDAALVKAHRLGVGGAMRLPPSSLAALEAFTAADTAKPRATPDCAMLSLIENGQSLLLVTVADRPFWRAQLGDPALVGSLVELAAALGVPASILPWPALIVAERNDHQIIDRWREISPAGIGIELQILPLTVDGGDVMAAAYGALLQAPPSTPGDGAREPHPVHELPHGRRVGWWSRHSVALEGEGWRASPTDITGARCRWHLEGADRGGIVTDVVTADEVSGVQDVMAVRLPGWLAHPLRPGSPAGLLAERIAEVAARRDLPLWIPGVDVDALRFVLGLPGTIWVDGPAVPR